jgi:hypothetical protein
MMYLQPNVDKYGAYYPPQSTKAPGLLELPDEFLEVFYNYGGFVTLTIEGDTVTAIEARTEDFEAWKATQTEEPEEETNGNSDNDNVTWAELDAAYNEGRDSAYE